MTSFEQPDALTTVLDAPNLDHKVLLGVRPHMDDVVDTLVYVFRFERDAAREIVRSYSTRTVSLGNAAIISMLHLEPIQIAADLAGASDRPLSTDEIDRYTSFERRKVMEPTEFMSPS